MDFHRSKVLLKKINALHDSADAFDGKFSKLEKDLVLQYVRDFYELLTANEEAPVKAEKAAVAAPVVVPVPVQPIATTPTPPPVIEEVVAAPVPVAAPAPVPPTPAPVVKVALDAPEVIVEEAKAEVEAKVAKGADIGAFQVLFEDENQKDVSSQFSLKPLADINKGMGINDKILMINSLFGGDQQLFSATITQLNDLGSMDEAKELIATGMASKHDWLNDGKIDTAKRFIHLVRRRYQ